MRHYYVILFLFCLARRGESWVHSSRRSVLIALSTLLSDLQFSPATEDRPQIPFPTNVEESQTSTVQGKVPLFLSTLNNW